MNLIESLKQTALTMNRLVEREAIKGYALIGGLAVSVWGVPRGTQDIDLLVSLARIDAIKLFRKELEKEGYNPEVSLGGVADPVPCLVKISQNDMPVDLIIATKNWEAEAVTNAVKIELSGVLIPVVSAEHLVVMKLKAGGPRDMLDAAELLNKKDLDTVTVKGLAKRLRVDKRLEKAKAINRRRI